MSDDPRRLTTEEQRERAHEARRHGEICAACGRTFDDRGTVYVERFAVSLRPFTSASPRRSQEVVYWEAPVGAECTSPALLARVDGREPQRCAGCGRGVYYASERRGRGRPNCSTRCVRRASAARRKAGKEGD